MKKERQQDIQKEVGYGFGTTIGFTNDGMVFLVSDSNDPEGKPMQTIIEFTPNEAKKLATRLVDTAQQAEKAKEVLM